MNKFIIALIFIIWNLIHFYFFWLNDVLKNADSFAYLQMAYNLKHFSIDGFWTGWFWFVYSMWIAFFNFFISNDFYAGLFFNLVCLNLIWWLCYLLWRNYFLDKYNNLFLILVFLSPILLNYNISILSENIYIPLFLILFLSVLIFKDIPYVRTSVFLWFILALMYLTRSEAFIYIWSVWLVFLYLLIAKKIPFSQFVKNSLALIISFLIFITPYLFYMHSLTWEWWLTNKWSSNLRQAELRWVNKMDDDWFEKAVWELTPDSHHLMAWFAWGLKYEKSYDNITLKEFVLKNPEQFFQRFLQNQYKLYSQNLFHLISGDAKELYFLPWSKLISGNILFLAIVLIPILLMFYWIIAFLREKNYYLIFSFLSFFLTASFFFTLFFVLDRYFVIFVPLFLFFIVYWVQEIRIRSNYFEIPKYILTSILLLSIYLLWIFSFYNSNKEQDEYYSLKKTAWEWLWDYHFWKTNLKILERFPIVTYYSWSKQRWITPYTDNIKDVIEYAKFNKIDYLVVDSMDFLKYRPGLSFLLNSNIKYFPWMTKLKEFDNQKWQKVIIYRFENK